LDLKAEHKCIPFVSNEFGRIGQRGAKMLSDMAERKVATWREGSTIERAAGASRMARQWRARIGCDTVARAISASAISLVRASCGQT
jgi:hypothetical protein